jgi:TPR repeat protein
LSAEQYAHAAEAEASYLRACRLQTMSSGELEKRLTGDPTEVATWIASAAKHGVPWAQLRLGQMLLDGTGAPPDPSMALRWFTRAAEAGLGEAMNMVGRCYENGWGHQVDLGLAAAWYRRSAEAGHDWGEYNYAHMLFDGRGVQRDLVEAAVWYARAARQGHSRAMNLLARCYEEGWGVARDRDQAAVWYRRSAEAGYFRAQYNHATLLAGVGKLDEAIVWFEAALSAAPRPSLDTMANALIMHPEARLQDLGRRMAPVAAFEAPQALEELA